MNEIQNYSVESEKIKKHELIKKFQEKHRLLQQEYQYNNIKMLILVSNEKQNYSSSLQKHFLRYVEESTQGFGIVNNCYAIAERSYKQGLMRVSPLYYEHILRKMV